MYHEGNVKIFFFPFSWMQYKAIEKFNQINGITQVIFHDYFGCYWQIRLVGNDSTITIFIEDKAKWLRQVGGVEMEVTCHSWAIIFVAKLVGCGVHLYVTVVLLSPLSN